MDEWSQFTINALVAAARFSGLATSFYLLRQANGFLDLSYAAAYLLAGYASVVVSSSKTLSFTAAIGLSVTALFALRPVTCLYRFRRDAEHGQTLAGFGVAVMAGGAALLAMGPAHYSSKPVDAIDPLVFFGGGRLVGSQLLVFCWGLGTVAVTMTMYYAPWTLGHHLRAHAESPFLSYCLGLPVKRIEYVALVLAGITIGGAASYGTWDVGVEPETGLRVALLALLAAYIGGGRSPMTCASGGLILGGCQEGIAYFVPATWKEGATLGLVVLVGAIVATTELFRLRRLVGGNL